MKIGTFAIGVLVCHAATAQTLDFPIPELIIQEFNPSPLALPQYMDLPDLGGRVTPALDQPGQTASFAMAELPEFIAETRGFFHVSSNFYQGALAASEIHGAREFLDHHYAALGRFRDAVIANGGGEFPTNPMAEWTYLLDLNTLIPLSYGGVILGEASPPLTDEEYRTLFAVRLFDTLPAPVQEGHGRLTLTHSAQTQPNGQAIDTPLTNDEIADTLPYRRVTFTADEATNVPVSVVRFALFVRYPIRVLSTAAVCSGDAPVLCEVAGPAPFEIEVELLAPALPPISFAEWHRLEVTAQVWAQGEWQDAATDAWGQEFRQCDVNFVSRLSSISGPPFEINALVDRLTALTTPNSSLLGQRLFPGPTRTALPEGEETRDIPPSSEAAELAQTIDRLSRNRGLDAYLEGVGNGTTGLNRAVGAAQQFGAMLQCHRADALDHFETIEVELATVRRQLDMYKRMVGYARLGRTNWIARVEAQRLVIQGQADTLGTPENAFADFISGTALGAFSSILTNAFTNAEAAARLGAAGSAISQAGAYLQIIQSLRELDTLSDWQATIIEASAFMEAEAYLEAMVRQYEDAQEDLTFLLRTLRETEAAACSCYLPAPRFE